MKNKKNELFLGFVSLVYSVTLLFVLISNFTNRSVDKWRFFYAFTQQSNLLVLVWLVLFGISVFKFPDLNKKIRNKTLMTSLTVYISITYFIVALVLDPIYTGKFNPLLSSSELWLHHLTPIVMWIMFFKVKGTSTIDVKKALLSLIYPLFYVVLNLIVGYTVTYDNGDMAFAYDFINPNSYNNVFMLLVVITGLLVVFSLFTVGLTKFKLYIDDIE